MHRRWLIPLLAAATLIALAAAPADAARRRARKPVRRPVLPPVRVTEKDVNLDEARRVAIGLRARGFEVILTRDADVFVSLGQRTALANGAQADLFLSVHNNASRKATVSGSEVYHQVGNDQGRVLAGRILAGLTHHAGTRPRGVFSRAGEHGADYYYVLRNTALLGVIVEGAYLSHPAEVRRFLDPAFRQRLADGIVAGVVDHFGPLSQARSAELAAPTRSPAGEALDPPPGLTGERRGRDTVVFGWQSVARATGYRVWRDGALVAEVRTSNQPVPPGQVGGEPARRLAVEHRGLALGTHRYEVRAFSEVAGRPYAESETASLDITLPWRVVVDAGHGGHDPGALGRF